MAQLSFSTEKIPYMDSYATWRIRTVTFWHFSPNFVQVIKVITSNYFGWKKLSNYRIGTRMHFQQQFYQPVLEDIAATQWHHISGHFHLFHDRGDAQRKVCSTFSCKWCGTWSIQEIFLLWQLLQWLAFPVRIGFFHDGEVNRLCFSTKSQTLIAWNILNSNTFAVTC